MPKYSVFVSYHLRGVDVAECIGCDSSVIGTYVRSSYVIVNATEVSSYSKRHQHETIQCMGLYRRLHVGGRGVGRPARLSALGPMS